MPSFPIRVIRVIRGSTSPQTRPERSRMDPPIRNPQSEIARLRIAPDPDDKIAGVLYIVLGGANEEQPAVRRMLP